MKMRRRVVSASLASPRHASRGPHPLLPCPLPRSQRLERTGILINAFRAVVATTSADLLPMVYLCTTRVAPAHAGVELGIGDATLIKARAPGRRLA